ncbi:putative motility protein [Bosea vestrisii]|uniref:putative motility protein n=1 Tax=Bosea vestrisii TaxID=151416 RepID=UPI0024E01AA1|nr:putative motility protein [Bosea vestrisii]WID94675.1 putative motility protein [Bosea vestrisii]
MSEMSVAIAQSLISMKSAATQQALQLEMVKQNADSDQALVAMLQQAADQQQQATLPAGQGGNLDITA